MHRAVEHRADQPIGFGGGVEDLDEAIEFFLGGRNAGDWGRCVAGAFSLVAVGYQCGQFRRGGGLAMLSVQRRMELAERSRAM